MRIVSTSTAGGCQRIPMDTGYEQGNLDAVSKKVEMTQILSQSVAVGVRISFGLRPAVKAF